MSPPRIARHGRGLVSVVERGMFHATARRKVASGVHGSSPSPVRGTQKARPSAGPSGISGISTFLASHAQMINFYTYRTLAAQWWNPLPPVGGRISQS